MKGRYIKGKETAAFASPAGKVQVPTRKSFPPTLVVSQVAPPLSEIDPRTNSEDPPQSGERAETGGMAFVRSSTETLGRVLHYWIPEEIQKDADAVGRSVRSVLASRLAAR